ncbi:MAG: NTP/NDP exchange transporter [Rhodospirillaceae bacterium]
MRHTDAAVCGRACCYTPPMRFALPDIRRDEWSAVAWSFLYFLCLLCSYYIMRPVRDEMGIQAGVGNLPWLFTATLVVMMVAVPLFGCLTARWERRVALPAVYLFFISNLLVFYGVFQYEALRVPAARAFFVWVSVFNLYAVSVFWSFMVDLYSESQGKRLFGFIAAGGTVGALFGPALTALVVPATGAVFLLLVSAILLAVSLLCTMRLSAWAQRRQARHGTSRGEALGGGVWDGIRAVLSSRYLLGISFYLVAYTVLSTLLYVETARLVSDTYPSSAERTRLFATLDLIVNALTLALQLIVTGQMLRRLGVTVTLALLPAFAVIGFGVLSAFPALLVMLAFGVTRRAGEFALSKPAREILFTVIPREEKYKAKNFIDTVVYRAGDAVSGWLAIALRSIGAGLSAVALAALPIAVAWLGVAIWLGRREEERRGGATSATRTA